MQHDKLGFYLDVAQIVQTLKQFGWNTRLDVEGDDSLLGMLWYIQKLLGESTNDSRFAGLRPFSRLRSLQTDLYAFYEQLAASLDDNVSSQEVILGRARRLQLHDLIGKFEQIFREEVEDRIVFISPERQSLMEFFSPEEFLHDTTDRQYFQYLPRIAQQNFEDAGKCLIYGLSGAAISTSLQAVEATIRFFYVRHGGPNKRPEWSKMIDWLRDQQPSLLPGNDIERRHCHATLDRLRQRYRNAVAHGRAYLETNKPDASVSEAEQVFRECWRAARDLAAETPRRRQLSLRIRISDQMNFDGAVGTYLYFWNPELPPLGLEHIEFDSSLAQDELIDETIVHTDFWPNCIQVSATGSLSRQVRECFRMQPNYAATIDPLISFVDKCRQDTDISRFNPDRPREEDINLLDLFVGIQHQVRNEPQQILTETWSMLDKFVESSLPPDGPSLVTDLRMQSAFRSLCENV